MQTVKITIEDGGWQNDAQKADLRQTLRTLPIGDYRLTIKQWKSDRSLEQNAYFHGAIIPLFAEEHGYTKQEAKAVLKDECAKTLHYRDLEDTIKKQPQSTAAMSVDEFSLFLQEIERVFLFLGMTMPDPEEFRNVSRR